MTIDEFRRLSAARRSTAIDQFIVYTQRLEDAAKGDCKCTGLAVIDPVWLCTTCKWTKTLETKLAELIQHFT